MGSKSSPPPAAPDYSGAAAQQGAASKELATQNTFANRPTQYTPWGSTTWGQSAGTDPSTGQPVTNWTQYQSLTPQLQGALDSQVDLQKGRSDLAQGFMGRVRNDYAQPFSWDNLPAMSGGLNPTTGAKNVNDFSTERDQYVKAAMDQARPENDYQQQALNTRLANQGITEGSEAWNREQRLFQDNLTRQNFAAIQAGSQQQQSMNQMLLANQGQQFGQEQTGANFQNALRQQSIAEQMQKRGMSLNEMNALLTGQQVGSPQMPSFMGATMAQPTNFLGAAQSQGQYQLNANQLQQQAANSQWGNIGQLAGAAAMFML